MKVYLDQGRFYRYAVDYEFTINTLNFFKALKEEFGQTKVQFFDGKWRFNGMVPFEKIKARFPNVEVEEQVKKDYALFNLALMMEKEKVAEVDKLKNASDSNIEINNIKGELYNYQKVGVDFFMHNGGKAILADGMGLGKSLQALAYAVHANVDKTLVICPATVKFSWEKEIKKWTDKKFIIINSKTKLTPELIAETDFFVINYDILAKLFPILSTIPFELLVVDECHYIKGNKAARTKYTKALSKNIPKKLLLSGTPLINRPIELYNSLYILDPKRWANWMDFTKKYCGGKMGYWGYEAKGATNLEELREQINPYFLRRVKEEVLKDLPRKIFVDIPVELETMDRKTYDLAVNNFQLYLEVIKEKTDEEIMKSLSAEQLTKLNELRTITTKGKTKATIDLVEQIVNTEEKVIVFSIYNEPLKEMKAKFGKSAVILTGESSEDEKRAAMDKFQEDPNVKIFLGGIKSAGVGITLTAATNVIFQDFSWTPADHAQAMDRAHRIGNTANSVTIYQMYTKDTIDDFMRELLEKKKDVFDRIMSGTADAQDLKYNIVKDLTKLMNKGKKKPKARAKMTIDKR